MIENSLPMILTNNQLVGENYIDWKRNLLIVLTAEKQKFVLNEPCPSVPTAESTVAQKQAYDKWISSDEMARCYILGSISNVLQQKHQNMDTATKIMDSLQEMFEQQGRQARQAAIRTIMNMRMKPGTPVRDHMLVLITQFNVAGVLGAEIKSETQVDMALETLPEMFSQFKVSYIMNKLNMSLTELMKELQNAESVLKTKTGDAFVVASAGPSYSKPKGKNGNKRKKPNKKGPQQNEKKVKGFQVTRSLNEGEHTLRVGTGAVVSAKAVGIVYLYFSNNKHLVLRHCYYVPEITRNLISVALLFRQGYYVHFSQMVVDITLNKALICKGHLNNDLYVLKHDDSSLHHIESNKRIKLSPTNETYLWHLRLGHINLNRIQRLVKDGSLSNLKVVSLPVCESCLEDNGIISQLSAPATPQQNGVSERRNRTLLDMVRSMLSFSKLSTSFWGYAIQTVIYLLNMVPSKSISKTPLELWNGRVPNLRHIRIWGCHAYVLKRKMDKMEPRSKLCMFVGYPKGTRGSYFYSPQDKKVFVSTNATFLENKHIEESESKSKVFLEEIAKSSTPEIRTEPTQFEFTFLPPLTTGFQTNEVVEDIGSNNRSPHHI
ncbi:uncharacterized protein LOC142550225 [Primulina tabacum]|uniref:uncharacterized protein LOC142550225 n=1 Tax=Primulina tabacum TaxID=48773 RepID=UPI003F599F89